MKLLEKMMTMGEGFFAPPGCNKACESPIAALRLGPSSLEHYIYLPLVCPLFVTIRTKMAVIIYNRTRGIYRPGLLRGGGTLALHSYIIWFGSDKLSYLYSNLSNLMTI